MKTHPTEAELALLAGDECDPVSRFFLNRHVQRCERCLDTVAEFVMLRHDIAADNDLPDMNWDRLASEMRANIHLGLEAGECVRWGVRDARQGHIWNPRLTAAFASLVLLTGAGILMRSPHAPRVETQQESVLESTGSGLQLRNGGTSMTLLNHHGSVADQTVSAQGVIQASFVDVGGVTINNVSLE